MFNPVHKDPAYADWAFTWYIGRYTDPAPTSPVKSKDTAHNKKRKAAEVHPGPIAPGGSFVDVSLRVIVRKTVGTVVAHQPKHPHGTTKLNGGHTRAMCISFSRRIKKAFEEALEKNGVVWTEGSGSFERPEELLV